MKINTINHLIKEGKILLLCAAVTLHSLAFTAKAEEEFAGGEDLGILVEEEPILNIPEPSPPQPSPPETAPPQTSPPETAPPQTSPPETAPPQTVPPETVPPETAPPETNPSQTNPPEETSPPVVIETETAPTVDKQTETETEAPSSETSSSETPPSETQDTPEDGREDELIITREKMKKGIRAGEKFQIILKVKNESKNKKFRKIRLQLDPQEGISLDPEQKTDQIKVKDLEPGKEKKIKVKLVADQVPENTSTMEMKATVFYQYDENRETKKEKAETVILLPVDKKEDKGPAEPGGGGGGDYGGGGYAGGYEGGSAEQKTIDPMTPNLIVSRYSYGKEVKAGDEFTLEMELQNTNKKITVENTVMAIDLGEGLVIADSSNTFYIEQLKPEETIHKEIKLKALPDAQATNGTVNIGFKYEYLKKEERAQGTSEVKITIPVIQQNRFSVGEIQKEEAYMVNEENSVSLPYVNKGKSIVYNIEARLESGMTAEESYKFLGNAEAGSSGTIDFFVTPTEAGTQEVKLTVTYEDAAGNEKIEERKIVLQVEDQAADEMENYFPEDSFPEEEGEKSVVKPIGQIAGGAAGTGLLTFLLALFKIRKHKKAIHFDEEI